MGLVAAVQLLGSQVVEVMKCRGERESREWGYAIHTLLSQSSPRESETFLYLGWVYPLAAKVRDSDGERICFTLA